MPDDEPPGGRPPSFSQRHGFSPFNTVLQLNDLDDRTRIDLWNFVVYPRYINVNYPDQDGLLIWTTHFGFPRDLYGIHELSSKINNDMRHGEWWKVFDLLEFLLRYSRDSKRQELTTIINQLLALNRVGYRVADTEVIPITSDEEIESIAEAAKSPLDNARPHIRRAVELFADRATPNFAKSIHEAISAAEAAANVLAGTQGLTLAHALADGQKDNPSILHPALIEGWKRIYGFTSDSGGIRHALKDGTAQPDQDLAQYFIVTCSAFVNLVAAITSRDAPELH